MTQNTQTSVALRADLNAVIGEVAAIYHERDTEARMITIGVLAQQHTLLLGPPGTGKSAIVRELTSRFESGRYWEILLSKFTAPTAIFGPIDVGALAQGTYRQILDGHATTAHVAFLDEIFKCSAAALNSMLAFLNERIYHPESGGAPISCPLVSAVCASNELGEDEATAALYDRLLIRMEVDYLAEPASFDRLLASAVTVGAGQAPVRTTVDLADLQQVTTREVPAIDLPATVIEAIRDIRSDLGQREITSSDRRWKQAVRVLQAAAWLEGRAAVAVDDLATLAHVLWDVPSNKTTVSRVIRGYLSPDDRDLANLEDQVDHIAAELDKLTADGDKGELQDWAVGKNIELATITKRIGGIRDSARRGGRAMAPYQRAADRAQQVYTRLLSEALGVAPDKIPALGGR
jgi:MoxR-like ATPase